jgi:hypothetical protein
VREVVLLRDDRKQAHIKMRREKLLRRNCCAQSSRRKPQRLNHNLVMTAAGDYIPARMTNIKRYDVTSAALDVRSILAAGARGEEEH